MNPTDRKPVKQNPKRQISAEERQRIIEKKKRKLRNRRRFRIFLLIFLTFAVIAGLVLSFCYLFRITGYKVDGNTKYSDSQVFESSGLKLQKNLFFSDINSAEKNLVNKLPYIGSVEIKRGLPGTLIFHVKETKPVCTYQSGDSQLLIDSNGKILELKPGVKPDKLPQLKCSKPVSEKIGCVLGFSQPDGLEKNILKIYNYLLYKIQDGDFKHIKPADISQPKSTKTGYTIEFNDALLTDVKTLYDDLAAALDDGRIKDVDYVNISEPVKTKNGYGINFTNSQESDPLQIYKDLLAAIEKSKLKDITVIDISDPQNVSLTYQNRIKLKIGTPSKLESRLALAAKVIEKENIISANQKGSIDLTIGDRAYWQPAQEE